MQNIGITILRSRFQSFPTLTGYFCLQLSSPANNNNNNNNNNSNNNNSNNNYNHSSIFITIYNDILKWKPFFSFQTLSTALVFMSGPLKWGVVNWTSWSEVRCIEVKWGELKWIEVHWSELNIWQAVHSSFAKFVSLKRLPFVFS